MVKLQVNGTANIVSMLPIDEKTAQKVRRNPNIVKNMLKDFCGDHLVETVGKQQYSCLGHSISDDKIENLKERIAGLKSFHKSFLEMVEDLPDTEEKQTEEVQTEETQTDSAVMNEIIKLLKEAKEKAAKNGMGLTAFLDNDEDMHYFGYMPPRLFALTKLPVILAYDEDSHE